MTIVFAIFIFLHGLAHLWYVALSLRLVPFKAEMGWSGHSWLLTNVAGDAPTRLAATIVYVVACLGLLASGAGLALDQPWFRPMMIASSVLSLLAIAIFWDGSFSQVVEKGLLGFLISLVATLVLLLT